MVIETALCPSLFGCGRDFSSLRGSASRHLTAVQALEAAKGSQLALETAVPIGTVLLVAAISALAAYTGWQITPALHVCHP